MAREGGAGEDTGQIFCAILRRGEGGREEGGREGGREGGGREGREGGRGGRGEGGTLEVKVRTRST